MVTENSKYKVFNSYTDNYYFLRDSTKRIVGLQGGTNSGKTFSSIQYIADYCIHNPKTKARIVAETASTLERGALDDLKELIDQSDILRSSLINPYLQRGRFRFKNKSYMDFSAVDTESKAKHGKPNILYLNEANHIPYSIAKKMITRTSDKIIIDYNSDSKFWFHKLYLNTWRKKDIDFFISNFMNNRFCPEGVKKDLLEAYYLYKKYNDQEAKNYWKVYGLGETGELQGVCIRNFNYCTFLPYSNYYKRGYGLDFGFSNDETALTYNCFVKGKGIFSKELVYETRLDTPDLISKFVELGVSKKELIVADSANPDAISQIRKKGYNIVPCKKFNGSIKSGVGLINSLGLTVTSDSDNLVYECENYKFKKNNDGTYSTHPEDKNNHALDSVRYWCQYELGGDYKKVHKLKSNKKSKRKFKIK